MQRLSTALQHEPSISYTAIIHCSLQTALTYCIPPGSITGKFCITNMWPNFSKVDSKQLHKSLTGSYSSINQHASSVPGLPPTCWSNLHNLMGSGLNISGLDAWVQFQSWTPHNSRVNRLFSPHILLSFGLFANRVIYSKLRWCSVNIWPS